MRLIGLIVLAAITSACSPAPVAAPPAATRNADQTQAVAPPTPTAAPTPAVPPTLAVTPVPTPRATAQSVVLTGQGTKNTKPFALSGGDYTVRWSATSSSSAGCFHVATLNSTEDERPVGEFPEHAADAGDVLIEGKKTVRDETEVYGLEPGRYYFDVTSGCSWSIAIRPQ